METIKEPTILIIDDMPIIRRAIRKTLKKHFSQARVFEAADGLEGEEKVATLCPSLVVLDYEMPGLNGLSVCERIRRNTRYDDIKILMGTGCLSQDIKSRAAKAGANAFFQKPFLENDFLVLVRQLLTHHHIMGRQVWK